MKWNTPSDLAEWQGVTVNRCGRVVKLYLPNNNLQGRIPEEIRTLRKLECLWLNDNLLSDQMPTALGALRQLRELGLQHNRLKGKIPEGLGALDNLETLDLTRNQLQGPIPGDLLKHRRYKAFEPGVAYDGPGLKVLTSKRQATKAVIFPIVIGYADLITDLFTAVSYYKSGHLIWFWLALLLALAPGFIFAQLSLPRIEWADRILIATNLSSLVEAGRTVDALSFSPVLALMRVIEPLFESVPQLLLQLYVMLMLWNESPGLGLEVASVCISATSLAVAATHIASEERLVYQTRETFGTIEMSRLCAYFPSLTGVMFGRVPATGVSSLRGLGTIHPRTHLWLCFVYHVLEIFCQFLPLVMLALVIRGWFFLVLPYLWISRGLMVLVAAWATGYLAELAAARKALDFRFRVRLVGMPFLDSILDGTVAFGFGLTLTLAEFLVCLAIYHSYTDDDLTAQVRETLAMIAGVCMFGKMVLAAIVIAPLMEGGGNIVADDTAGALPGESVLPIC